MDSFLDSAIELLEAHEGDVRAWGPPIRASLVILLGRLGAEEAAFASQKGGEFCVSCLRCAVLAVGNLPTDRHGTQELVTLHCSCVFSASGGLG